MKTARRADGVSAVRSNIKVCWGGRRKMSLLSELRADGWLAHPNGTQSVEPASSARASGATRVDYFSRSYCRQPDARPDQLSMESLESLAIERVTSKQFPIPVPGA